MSHRNRPDLLLADIQSAVAAGHFDARDRDGPSELERTPVAELMNRVSMMSPERRREELAQLGRVRTDDPPEETTSHVRLRRPSADVAVQGSVA